MMRLNIRIIRSYVSLSQESAVQPHINGLSINLRQRALHNRLYRIVIAAVVVEVHCIYSGSGRGSGVCIDPISMDLIDED